MDDIRPNVPAAPVRLFDQLRRHMRDHGYAWKTEKTYLHWVRRFILFHGKQHPARLSARHVNEFLSNLANEGHCSPATQRVALNALIYLYKRFLGVELEQLDFGKAKPKRRLPVVLSHGEVLRILEHLQGKHRLIVELLYGAGLRQAEVLSLRIKDLDFELSTITVRSGKGDKDRSTLLPERLKAALGQQIEFVCKQHQRDIEDGFGEVYLPNALAKKYPQAARETAWQFLFPSSSIGPDPRSKALRRHHLHESSLRKAVTQARRGAMGVLSPLDGD